MPGARAGRELSLGDANGCVTLAEKLSWARPGTRYTSLISARTAEAPTGRVVLLAYRRWKQVGTTTRVAFRAAITADGELDLGVTL